MPRNPERLAWTVLWLSFFTFCTLVVGIPTAIQAYVSGAMEDRVASLQILNGTVLMQQRGAKFEVNAAGGGTDDPTDTMLAEGDAFRTVENSRAVLWLFDGSNFSLWPDTRVALNSIRATKFNSNKAVISLNQESGHIRFEVAPSPIKTRNFEVRTPEATLALREGSYSVTRTQGKTEVVTHRGWATLATTGTAVDVLQNERVEVISGQPSIDPLPAARDLIANGNFGAGLQDWTVANRDEEEPILGTADLLVQDGRNVIDLKRTGATKHCETYLFQALNKDVTDFDSVKLRLDFKLVYQSLSGGGFLGSEYPLLIRLKYRDIYNGENTFVKGFYYQNESGNPTHNGEKVSQGEWHTYDIDLLDPRGALQPKPTQLVWLEIAASGHNYESLVTNIRLIAE
ncbi:MAG: FecR family protein [Chloroflexi bacterium]|nr:FecR family protein [Chloroflexota bacterium]